MTDPRLPGSLDERDTAGPVHHVDAGRYRAVLRKGVPMVERADTAGAVTFVEALGPEAVDMAADGTSDWPDSGERGYELARNTPTAVWHVLIDGIPLCGVKLKTPERRHVASLWRESVCAHCRMTVGPRTPDARSADSKEVPSPASSGGPSVIREALDFKGLEEDWPRSVAAALAALDALIAERDEAFAIAARKRADERAADARAAELEAALEAIARNAEAWHGPPEDSRHAAALVVIAKWARDPSTVPEGIRDHIAAARSVLTRDGDAT